MGDFEYAAARVVARLTGEQVTLQDDGSRDGMVDIRVDYADRPSGYVEVWTEIEPGYAATHSRLMGPSRQLPHELLMTALRRDWFVTVSGASDLRRLEAEIEDLVGSLETSGLTFETVADLRVLNTHPDPNVNRLVALGVVMLSSRPATMPDHGAVRLSPPGIEGPVHIRWEPVLDWIANTLVSPQLNDVRSKLARTGADERHAFLGISFSSPGDVYFALSMEEHSLPREPPKLPDEITHLWLMQAPPLGRCLAWFPDRGWLDVMWHWATD